jgi:hypothetical protein
VKVVRSFEMALESPERGLEAAYQALLIEGLAEKADCACVEHAFAEAILWKGGDEYDRRVYALSVSSL